MPHKHQAHAAKAAGQEVLERTDVLRLVCHGQSSAVYLAAPGGLGLAPLPQLHYRFRRPFAYIREGGALGRSEGGSSGPSTASARSLLPPQPPPLSGRGFLNAVWEGLGSVCHGLTPLRSLLGLFTPLVLCGPMYLCTPQRSHTPFYGPASHSF